MQVRLNRSVFVPADNESESAAIFIPKGSIGTVVGAEGTCEVRVVWGAAYVADRLARGWEWCVPPDGIEVVL